MHLCIILRAICHLFVLKNITNTVRLSIIFLSTADQRVKIHLFCWCFVFSAVYQFLVHPPAIALSYVHTAPEPLPSVPTQMLCKNRDLSWVWFHTIALKPTLICSGLSQGLIFVFGTTPDMKNLSSSQKRYLSQFCRSTFGDVQGEMVPTLKAEYLRELNVQSVPLSQNGMVGRGESWVV